MEEALRIWRPFVTIKGHAVGLGLYLALASLQVRETLEATLIGHMLVQIPLLIACGWLVARRAHFVLRGNGVAELLVAVFALAFWMIPRWLDAALTEPMWEVVKFITVPLCIGAPLGLSWKRLSTLARGFVWANGISMLAVLGWLYVAAPVRVCNNYLIDQQHLFGYVAMSAAFAIALYWGAVGFLGDWSDQGEQP